MKGHKKYEINVTSSLRQINYVPIKVINKIKKEVFDDLDKFYGGHTLYLKDYIELKERHLSTFPKKEKETNSRFSKLKKELPKT